MSITFIAYLIVHYKLRRRRLYLLPFTQTFKGRNRDPHLAETQTHEYQGILQWIVEGAMAYQDEGLAPPLLVREATSIYFEEEDIFQQWLCARCQRICKAN